MLKKAPAAISVCADKRKSMRRGLWMLDCSVASENLLLAAEAIGLGAVWTAAYPIEERIKHVQKVLNLPEEVIPINVIPIGWPTGVEKPKNKFDPKNIHWETWKEK